MSADLALAADPSVVERAADPAEYIVQCCERGKWWLKAALERDDMEAVLEAKAQAEAIRVYTVSKGYGADAKLSAEEIIRRAERGLALAVRKGQRDGTVRGNGQYEDDDLGADTGNTTSKIAPGDWVGHGGTRSETYAMTDGVSDEDFEDALAKAKNEENLSRANVVRKARVVTRSRGWIPEPGISHGDAPARRRELIREWAAQGYSSRQMAPRLGMRIDAVTQIAREGGIDVPADKIIGRTRRHDSNRIVRETVHALEGLAMGVQLVERDDLDICEVANWATSLTDSIRVLNRLVKTMKEIAQ